MRQATHPTNTTPTPKDTPICSPLPPLSRQIAPDGFFFAQPTSPAPLLSKTPQSANSALEKERATARPMRTAAPTLRRNFAIQENSICQPPRLQQRFLRSGRELQEEAQNKPPYPTTLSWEP